MNLEQASQALIALAIVDWFVTAVLYIASVRLREPALTERAAASVILSLVASLFALLGAHVLGVIAIPAEVRILMLVAAGLLVSLPQLVWFFGLLLGKFR